MGTLVIMHYPTTLALGAADHTYVKCDTGGKAWSCWGGKTGGSELRRATGSTKQAEAIAEPKEHAGITCYLINGVCHQAANRILFPAGILVRGARGYGLSELIYGPYGRASGAFGTCQAPFNQHNGVTGDLPECAAPTFGPRAIGQGGVPLSLEEREREQIYFERVQRTYTEGGALDHGARLGPSSDMVEFMVQLMMHKIDFNLGPDVDRSLIAELRQIRVSAEHARAEIEIAYGRALITPRDFVMQSERQVRLLQERIGAVLEPNQYERFLNLKLGEIVTLADPGTVKQEYGV